MLNIWKGQKTNQLILDLIWKILLFGVELCSKSERPQPLILAFASCRKGSKNVSTILVIIQIQKLLICQN